MRVYGRAPIVALIVLTSLACSESQAPRPDGPPFMTATVDGVRWAAGSESGDLYALLGPQRVILAATFLAYIAASLASLVLFRRAASGDGVAAKLGNLSQVRLFLTRFPSVWLTEQW